MRVRSAYEGGNSTHEEHRAAIVVAWRSGDDVRVMVAEVSCKGEARVVRLSRAAERHIRRRQAVVSRKMIRRRVGVGRSVRELKSIKALYAGGGGCR